MGYEVDFLPVGEKSKSGDAIAIRFGNLHGERSEQIVVVIDGGFKESGEKLVEHIQKYYNTKIVDLAILTHPDNDHASGLHVLLKELEVKKLWMHKAWEHTDGTAILFEDGRITDNSIGTRLKESLETAYGLEKLANEKGIEIEEPFTGLTDYTGCVSVLGPSEEFFERMLVGFSGLPETVTEEASMSKSFFEKAKDIVINWISEKWNFDLIIDDGETTSYQNNSSAIIQLVFDNSRMLFTGDAGREALAEVVELLNGYNLPDLKFIQIPHHGSFRNIGPTVLNGLVGEIKPKDHKPHFSAFVSAAKEGAPKHPSKKVINSFIRRGARVHVTAGAGKHHYDSAPDRDGWSSATPEKFYKEVEE